MFFCGNTQGCQPQMPGLYVFFLVSQAVTGVWKSFSCCLQPNMQFECIKCKAALSCRFRYIRITIAFAYMWVLLCVWGVSCIANLSKICSSAKKNKKMIKQNQQKERPKSEPDKPAHVWSCTRVQQGCCCHCFTNSSASCLSMGWIYTQKCVSLVRVGVFRRRNGKKTLQQAVGQNIFRYGWEVMQK